MDKVKIGQFIANCRKDKKITQEQLAEKLNISKNAVSKWERGICYTTLLFGFSAVVYFYKYKQNNNRTLLVCAWCMIVAFIANFIAFIISTI